MHTNGGNAFMPAALHLVPRLTAEIPHPLYYDLLNDGHSRVLELFEAHRQVPVIDLSLAERDIPEVVAALHWAEEVHAHGIHPELVLRVLPAVREDSLRHTTLVLHGSWLPLPAIRDLHITRLKRWPGPARHDTRGNADDVVARVSGRVEQVAPMQCLDVQRADLLPRATGAVPILLADGRRLATVVLAATLDDGLRTSLHSALPSVGHSDVVIQTCDEADLPRGEWAEVRRAAQAYITRAAFSPELLEATLQEIPIIALYSPNSLEFGLHDLPADAVRLGGRGQSVDRVVSCVRSWATRWAEGLAGPVDLAGRRTFAARWLRPEGSHVPSEQNVVP